MPNLSPYDPWNPVYEEEIPPLPHQASRDAEDAEERPASKGEAASRQRAQQRPPVRRTSR